MAGNSVLGPGASRTANEHISGYVSKGTEFSLYPRRGPVAAGTSPIRQSEPRLVGEMTTAVGAAYGPERVGL